MMAGVSGWICFVVDAPSIEPNWRRAAVRRPLPAPTSRQKGLVGVSEMPSLLNAHSRGPVEDDGVDADDVEHAGGVVKHVPEEGGG